MFTERLFDVRLQAAFGAGFVAWGLYISLDGSAMLGGFLILSGLFYLGSQTPKLMDEFAHS